LGCALAPVELENSSDQTSVPEAILGAKLWLVMLLTLSPEAVAMALMVIFDATRKGAKYRGDDALGTLLSTE
jgi:hypothetical protein